MSILCGCGQSSSIVVYMPDGAPSLSLVSLMAQDYKIGGHNTDYTIVSSEQIGGFVASKQADLAVLPTNLASKLCGDDYQILSVMTTGNLYLVGKQGSSINDVIGHNLSVINLNNVPGLTVKLMLNELGIPYSEGEQTESNIKLVGATANEIIGGFMSGKIEFAVVAEPAVSMMLNKVNDLQVIDSIQRLVGNYPQSVLVIKKGIFKNKDVQELYNELLENETYLQNNLDNVYNVITAHLQKGVVTSFKEDLINEDLIMRCNVNISLAIEEKDTINNYINNLINISNNSANVLTDEVYYEFK